MLPGSHGPCSSVVAERTAAEAGRTASAVVVVHHILRRWFCQLIILFNCPNSCSVLCLLGVLWSSPVLRLSAVLWLLSTILWLSTAAAIVALVRHRDWSFLWRRQSQLARNLSCCERIRLWRSSGVNSGRDLAKCVGEEYVKSRAFQSEGNRSHEGWRLRKLR